MWIAAMFCSPDWTRRRQLVAHHFFDTLEKEGMHRLRLGIVRGPINKGWSLAALAAQPRQAPLAKRLGAYQDIKRQRGAAAEIIKHPLQGIAVITQGIALMFGDNLFCEKRADCSAGACLETREGNRASIYREFLLCHLFAARMPLLGRAPG